MVSYCLIMLLWSGVGGQLLSHHVAVVRGWWSAIVSSCCCGQGLVVSHSHHVAVVRGWLSAIFSSCCRGQGLMVSYCLIMLLWSGVGCQPFSSCCCGQGLVVSYFLIMLLWSGVDGQLLSHHVAVVRGWRSAIVSSCCCGHRLVVHYSHHVAVVRGWWSTIVIMFGGQLSTRSLEGPFRGAFGKKGLRHRSSFMLRLCTPRNSVICSAQRKYSGLACTIVSVALKANWIAICQTYSSRCMGKNVNTLNLREARILGWQPKFWTEAWNLNFWEARILSWKFVFLAGSSKSLILKRNASPNFDLLKFF